MITSVTRSSFSHIFDVHRVDCFVFSHVDTVLISCVKLATFTRYMRLG